MSAVPAAQADAVYDVVQMAFELADTAARSNVECIGLRIDIDEAVWYDLLDLSVKEHHVVVLSLRYMHARGPSLPYRVICHPNHPYLRRFEDRQ